MTTYFRFPAGNAVDLARQVAGPRWSHPPVNPSSLPEYSECPSCFLPIEGVNPSNPFVGVHEECFYIPEAVPRKIRFLEMLWSMYFWNTACMSMDWY